MNNQGPGKTDSNVGVKEMKFLLVEAEADNGDEAVWFAYRDEDWQDGKPMPGASRGIGDTPEEAIAGLVIRLLNERETTINLPLRETKGFAILKVGCDKMNTILKRLRVAV